MKSRIFAPGCALVLYKPELVEKLHQMLNTHFGNMPLLSTCCHHDPNLTEPTEIINICPGCDKRFRNNYKNVTTLSLWEIMAEADFFAFPDYKGQQMTINDACPTRDKEQIHEAIRKVLQRMNIHLVEPEKTRTKGTCCGDSFYGILPTEKVKELMVKRAAEMPLNDVVVYCVSCVKSMYIGSKQPHYLVDMLFAHETQPQIHEPDEWHKQLDLYIESH